MADTTISAAASLTASTVADGDLIPVLDISASAGIKASKMTVAELKARVLAVTPYDAGNLTGDVTPSLANGAVQYGTQTGNISIEAPTGTPVEKVSAIELYVTGNGGTLDFDAAIIRASDSAASFPKTLTNTKVYLVQLRYFKTQWNLVTLVGGY